jgi:hypothetical protein
MPIRIIRHETSPNCGSFEVRFSDGRVSQFFYWDDEPGRLRPEQLTSDQALRLAREFFARAMREQP